MRHSFLSSYNWSAKFRCARQMLLIHFCVGLKVSVHNVYHKSW